MQFINIKLIVGLVVALSVAGSALAFHPTVSEDDALLPPELPPACGTLRVEQGNEVAFHVYAIGVQIYRWTGTAWVLFAPDANLYADANYRGKVGTHYGGPTWESTSGSNVIGTRVDGCDLDPANTIPWLLLKKVSSEGPGVFSNATFIQRVNTTGGVKPSAPGLTIGEEKRVPYTAEYYFYRAAD